MLRIKITFIGCRPWQALRSSPIGHFTIRWTKCIFSCSLLRWTQRNVHNRRCKDKRRCHATLYRTHRQHFDSLNGTRIMSGSFAKRSACGEAPQGTRRCCYLRWFLDGWVPHCLGFDWQDHPGMGRNQRCRGDKPHQWTWRPSDLVRWLFTTLTARSGYGDLLWVYWLSFDACFFLWSRSVLFRCRWIFLQHDIIEFCSLY